jgi:hypothetical protein
MINKQDNNKVIVDKENIPVKEPGIKDIAYMDMQCHLLIKDNDTGEILVNQRG